MNSRFSSDENIIDIDHLGAKSLGTTPRTPETSLNEANFSHFEQQRSQVTPKELTLSRGGSCFLKSNRSQETTPCNDETKSFEDNHQRPSTSGLGSSRIDDNNAFAVSEKLKSILREKQNENGKSNIIFVYLKLNFI